MFCFFFLKQIISRNRITQKPENDVPKETADPVEKPRASPQELVVSRMDSTERRSRAHPEGSEAPS